MRRARPGQPVAALAGRPLGRRALLISALGLCGGLAACAERGPVRIGFLGGLSGRGANAAEDGRNGALLAVERRNLAAAAAGHGRALELVVQDNGSTQESAHAAVEALIEARVHAVVGPLISAVALDVMARIDQARLLMLSPTATATELAGRDDYLIRLAPTASDSARQYARVLHGRGLRRLGLALAVDPRNAPYSQSWRSAFREAYEGLGGAVVHEIGFAAQAGTSFAEIARQMLAGRPDGLLFIGSSMDVARLAQQARQRAPSLPFAAAEAAAGESLITLGGDAVEGMLVAQLHNRDDVLPRYAMFRDTYKARFGHTPGYHAVFAHDAVTVLVDSLARAGRDVPARQAVLAHGPYQGLQQDIAFDRFGDCQRALHFAVIQGRRYALLP